MLGPSDAKRVSIDARDVDGRLAIMTIPCECLVSEIDVNSRSGTSATFLVRPAAAPSNSSSANPSVTKHSSMTRPERSASSASRLPSMNTLPVSLPSRILRARISRGFSRLVSFSIAFLLTYIIR